jgi:hypothetical protein
LGEFEFGGFLGLWAGTYVDSWRRWPTCVTLLCSWGNFVWVYTVKLVGSKGCIVVNILLYKQTRFGKEYHIPIRFGVSLVA